MSTSFAYDSRTAAREARRQEWSNRNSVAAEAAAFAAQSPAEAPSPREVLRAEVETKVARLAGMDALPVEDDFPEFAVITFTRTFPDAPERSYTYAALKAEGRWYLTGRDRAPHTWDSLVAFIAHRGPTEVWHARQWEQVA